MLSCVRQVESGAPRRPPYGGSGGSSQVRPPLRGVETYPHIDVAVDAVDSAALGYLRYAY